MKKDIEEIIRLNKEGYTLKQIAIHYNTYYQNIQCFIKNRNVKLIQWPKNRSIVHDFFSNINSEIKAYLLGFFIADGCVYDKGRIGICISKKDEDIINLYKSYIAPESYIKETLNTKGAINRKPQLMWRISSTQIIKDLELMGIKPRKTYYNLELPLINPDYVKHMIRGIFDGDGCISVSLKPKVRANITFVCTSKILLETIALNLPVKCFINCRISKSKMDLYYLQIYSKDSICAMYNYFYSDAKFYLQRKKDKFNLYLDNTEITTRSKELIVL